MSETIIGGQLYSLLVEALNLIVESKSLPVEVNNLTIELHFPVKA